MRPNVIAKVILLSFSSVILVGTFQNCAQASGTAAFTPSSALAEHNPNPSSGSMDKIENIDLSSAEYIDVSLRSLFSNDLSVQSNSDRNKNLKINLSNGEMRYINLEGEIISPMRLCMRPQELIEFKSILQSLKVCQPHVPRPDEAVMCTQVYEYPFALLQYTNGDKIKLGEVAGCARSLDLCAEHKEVFNGFISYLRNHLESRKCL